MKRTVLVVVVSLASAALASAEDFRCSDVLANAVGGGVMSFEAAAARTVADHDTIVQYGAPMRVPRRTVGIIVDNGPRPDTYAVCWTRAIRVQTRLYPGLFTPPMVYEGTVPYSAIEALQEVR